MIIRKLDKTLVDRVSHGVATVEDFKSLGVENVLAIKSDPFVEKRRMVAKTVPASVDLERRTVFHEASNNDRDRIGDVVDPRGWDLTNYKFNAQVLWMHIHYQPPVGRGVGSKKGKGATGANALFLNSKIHEEEKYPFAELLWKFIADGDLPACSVGFMPKGLEYILRPKDEEEAKKMNVMWPWGVKYVGQELLENSIVTIPALSSALARKLDQYAEKGISWSLISDFKRSMEPNSKSKLFLPAHVEYTEEDELGEIAPEEKSFENQDFQDEELEQEEKGEESELNEEVLETVAELKSTSNAIIRELRSLRKEVAGLKAKGDPKAPAKTEPKPASAPQKRLKALAAASRALSEVSKN